MASVNSGDQVVLLHALPHFRLLSGDVGRVCEARDDGEYDLMFEDCDGCCLGIMGVPGISFRPVGDGDEISKRKTDAAKPIFDKVGQHPIAVASDRDIYVPHVSAAHDPSLPTGLSWCPERQAMLLEV